MSEVEAHQSNGKGHPETFRASSARVEKVFEFCKKYIEEHGTGPTTGIIAKGAGLPAGAVAGAVTRLFKLGRLALLEPGSYSSMRLPLSGAPQASPVKRKGRKPRKASASPRAKKTPRVAAWQGDLRELRAEFVEKIRAIDAVLKLR